MVGRVNFSILCNFFSWLNTSAERLVLIHLREKSIFLFNWAIATLDSCFKFVPYNSSPRIIYSKLKFPSKNVIFPFDSDCERVTSGGMDIYTFLISIGRC